LHCSEKDIQVKYIQVEKQKLQHLNFKFNYLHQERLSIFDF